MNVIIAIINNKGGTGKTTCTVNLAHALANQGKKILVIDQDAQSNTSQIFVGSEVETNTLYDVFTGRQEVENCIYPTPYDNVFCLPNIPATATLEKELYDNVVHSYQILRDKLRPHAIANYDATLIDCPPNLGMFVYQALISSDFVIVPIESGSRYALDGLISAIEHIESIKRNVNPDLAFLRLLINKVDLRTSISKAAVEQIKKKFGKELVFETTIPINTEFQKAEEDRKTLIRYSPRSAGAKKYRALAEELCKILEVKE